MTNDERMDRMDGRVDRIESRMDRMEARLTQIESDIEELKRGQAEIKSTLSLMSNLLARIDGRMDKQRATINALIPVRIAAVPPAAA
jgi:chromosome segregation ATPase